MVADPRLVAALQQLLGARRAARLLADLATLRPMVRSLPRRIRIDRMILTSRLQRRLVRAGRRWRTGIARRPCVCGHRGGRRGFGRGVLHPCHAPIGVTTDRRPLLCRKPAAARSFMSAAGLIVRTFACSSCWAKAVSAGSPVPISPDLVAQLLRRPVALPS